MTRHPATGDNEPLFLDEPPDLPRAVRRSTDIGELFPNEELTSVARGAGASVDWRRLNVLDPRAPQPADSMIPAGPRRAITAALALIAALLGFAIVSLLVR